MNLTHVCKQKQCQQVLLHVGPNNVHSAGWSLHACDHNVAEQSHGEQGAYNMHVSNAGRKHTLDLVAFIADQHIPQRLVITVAKARPTEKKRAPNLDLHLF